VLLRLGVCCAFAQLLGCMPMAGTAPYPIGYPGQPVGVYPRPYPPGIPGHPVGYPRFPGGPGVPIVNNPAPFPRPGPVTPVRPVPNPGTVPTIPVGLPAPLEPADDSTDFWSPWPLPPRGNQLAAGARGLEDASADRVAKTRNSQASRGFRSGDRRAAIGGIPGNDSREQSLFEAADSVPNGDLKFHGGKTIRDLFYVNLYVSGDTQWSAADVKRIDASLSAAMRDEHLNNVLLQYFDNQSITSTALPSHPLVGYTPKTVTRGDIQNYVAYLHRQGFLRSYDLSNTVFNLLLPPGTVLTAGDKAANAVREDLNALTSNHTFATHDIVPEFEEGDSLNGLAGYHGSVVVANGGRVYYSVGVYSQRFSNGALNGIPVFREPWKNVVATLYHQLVEVRTDPDVEDAIRNSSDPNAKLYLGWVSDSGLEIGDFPINANVPLTSVIREVPLADGSGTVPVQLPYSNVLHGPEGPIPRPHPVSSR